MVIHGRASACGCDGVRSVTVTNLQSPAATTPTTYISAYVGAGLDGESLFNFGGVNLGAFHYDSSAKIVAQTQTIIEFDLSSLIGQLITSVVLRLNVTLVMETAAPSRACRVNRLTPRGVRPTVTDWTEGTTTPGDNNGSGATWLTYPAAQNDGAPAGFPGGSSPREIISAAVSGARTRFATAAAHSLALIDLVHVAGMSAGDEAYNGLWSIAELSDSTHFDILTTFGSTATGYYTIQPTTHRWLLTAGLGSDYSSADEHAFTGPVAGFSGDLDIGSSPQMVALAQDAINNQNGRLVLVIRCPSQGSGALYLVQYKTDEHATAADRPELIITSEPVGPWLFGRRDFRERERRPDFVR